MISVDVFFGEIPLLADEHVIDGYATIAQDCLLRNGNIEPINEPELVHTFTTAPQGSFMRWKGQWISFATKVNAVPAPVDEDVLYYTGDGAPKIMLPGNTVRALKLAPPVNPPTLSIPNGTVDPNTQETIHYAYTFVTDKGEESQPSPLSAPLLWSPGLAVRLTGFDPAPPGRGITKMRIYRSQTSLSGATELFYVDEIAATVTQIDHDIAVKPLVEPIPSADFDMPPDTMEGLIALPNGMMAAYTGKELLFCEPYQPHAWPIKYRLKTDYPIMGLVAIHSAVVVLTTGTPYVAQGTHPDSMIMEKTEENLPCVSKDSVVDMGYAAAYASRDGIVMVTTGGARLVSSKLVARTKWNDEFHPHTINATLWNGDYLFTFGYAPNRKTALINVKGELPYLLRYTDQPLDYYYDLELDDTFLLDGDGVSVKKFAPSGTAPRKFIWQSKNFQLPYEVSLGAVFVEMDEPSGVATDYKFHIYADNQFLQTSAYLHEVDRLKPARAIRWKFKIETNCTVRRARMARTPAELALTP